MLMNPNKGETAVHGHHCSGDMAVRMREVLARPWIGVCVSKVCAQVCLNFMHFERFIASSSEMLEVLGVFCLRAR